MLLSRSLRPLARSLRPLARSGVSAAAPILRATPARFSPNTILQQLAAAPREQVLFKAPLELPLREPLLFKAPLEPPFIALATPAVHASNAWSFAMAGDDDVMQMSSVKKKRRMKMNKHKRRKRRKLNRLKKRFA